MKVIYNVNMITKTINNIVAPVGHYEKQDQEWAFNSVAASSVASVDSKNIIHAK